MQAYTKILPARKAKQYFIPNVNDIFMSDIFIIKKEEKVSGAVNCVILRSFV